jgi:hypothetical protein
MSPTELSDILVSFRIEEFLESYLGRMFLHIPGNPGKYAGLLPWKVLNDILTYQQLESPRLRLVRHGKPVPPDSYVRYRGNKGTQTNPKLALPEFITHLREGATLILDRIDEMYHPIGSLCRGLERVFQVHVRANMYAGWRISHGFNLHWDEHDVLVLQVSGRKAWRIYGQTQKFPLDRSVDAKTPPKGVPFWEGTIQDGDALYLPRGWWHIATPCDEPSLHLTFAIPNLTGVDLLRWVFDQMRSYECLRMDLPRFASDLAKATHFRTIQDVIAEVCGGSDLIERFLRSANENAEPRFLFGLPWSATPGIIPESDEYIIRSAAAGRPEIRPVEQAGEVEVIFRGTPRFFPESTLGLFEFLAGNTPVSVREFYGMFEPSFNRQELASFLADLVKWGLIAVQEPSAN